MTQVWGMQTELCHKTFCCLSWLPIVTADVLIHVVDASGSTDKGGVQLGAGTTGHPVEDINWVREEIHRHVHVGAPGTYQAK